MEPPDISEVHRAVNQMASGLDGLPPELFKSGCPVKIDKLLSLYTSIWSNGTVPQKFKDAQIVHIFKRKGDRSVCDDHRGISLLSIPEKILARIISTGSCSMSMTITYYLKVSVDFAAAGAPWT